MTFSRQQCERPCRGTTRKRAGTREGGILEKERDRV
jgi:hypothetical protein